MKYAIMYCSKTGNTRQLAEAIYEAFPEKETRIEAVSEKQISVSEPVILVGFWVDKGTCPSEIQALLQTLHGKQVALFGTAGFGASSTYFAAIAARVQAFLPEDNRLLGSYLCQGKMPTTVRDRYAAQLAETPGDAHLQGLLENFDHARTHPDESDLQAAKEFAKRILKQTTSL